MKDKINFLLAGVGGQGTILASDVLVTVGLKSGFQVKQAEVHGMSQRGGSVTSHVRWGKIVFSPIVGSGEVDVLMAFEKAEALRNLPQLRADALVLVNMEEILPLTVTSGGQPYPSDENLKSTIAKITSHAAYVHGSAIAQELGNPRVANVVLLGALSSLLERENFQAASQISVDSWLEVISERVPSKYIELNRKAFHTGRDAVKN